MIFRVYVNFKDGILDPEAEAIKQTIANIGLKSVKNLFLSSCFKKYLKFFALEELFLFNLFS